MNIVLITFGKIKIPGLAETRDHYLRGLQPWVAAHELELRAEVVPQKSDAVRDKVRTTEAERIQESLAKLSQPRRVLALDESGKAMTSKEWAKLFETYQNESIKDVAFVVGGGLGLSRDFLKSCDRVVSLGPQTLAHDLARAVLWEQTFRAFSILRGHPYHND